MFSRVYIRTQCVFHILEPTCPVNELYSFHLTNTSRHFQQKTRALSKRSHKIVWTYWRSITTQTIFSDIQIRGVWWRWFTWLKLVNLPVLAEEDARTDRLKSMCLSARTRMRACVIVCVCNGARSHCSSDQHSPQTLSTNPNIGKQRKQMWWGEVWCSWLRKQRPHSSTTPSSPICFFSKMGNVILRLTLPLSSFKSILQLCWGFNCVFTACAGLWLSECWLLLVCIGLYACGRPGWLTSPAILDVLIF